MQSMCIQCPTYTNTKCPARVLKLKGKKLKLKQFFLKTQAVFKKKLKKPEIFQNINCQLIKINHHMDHKCHFQQFSTVKKEDFCQKFNRWMVFQKLKGKFSLTQAIFLKTQAKCCQNSSKILKNSIYRKFQLRPLPQKTTKNKPALKRNRNAHIHT